MGNHVAVQVCSGHGTKGQAACDLHVTPEGTALPLAPLPCCMVLIECHHAARHCLASCAVCLLRFQAEGWISVW